MQHVQASVTNGFRNAANAVVAGKPVIQEAVPQAQPIVPKIPQAVTHAQPATSRAEPVENSERKPEVIPDGYLPNILGRIYDFIEKKDDAVTRKEVMEALVKEGYKGGTVNASVNTLKMMKVLETYTGGGSKGDPEFLWFTQGAIRPTGQPYRQINSTTREERDKRKYEAAKALGQQYNETQKRIVNNTPKQIPPTTNSSLASELHRLHVGETQMQPAAGEVRSLPAAIGAVSSVKLASEVPEALKNMEFKLSWRGQEISFEEVFKMKAELEILTQMISGFSVK